VWCLRFLSGSADLTFLHGLIPMRRRASSSEVGDELNVWSAFTDLMSNAFLMVIFLLFLLLLSTASSLTLKDNQAKTTVGDSRSEISRLQNRVNDLTQQIEQKNQQFQNELLPVYEFPETNGYKFDPGSATLPEKLQSQIQNETTRKLRDIAQERGIDTIEVIGHTDGQTVGGVSNLDECLPIWLSRRLTCQPGSNADLGLLRALAVVELLRSLQQQGQLPKNLQFRPYSAAQLIPPDLKELVPAENKDDNTRRRIEIRLAPRTFNQKQ